MFEKISQELQNIFLISQYPLLIYKNASPALYFPKNPSEHPLLCNPELAQRILSSSGFVTDIFVSDIFYLIQRFEGNIVCIIGPLTDQILSPSDRRNYFHSHNMRLRPYHHIKTISMNQTLAAMRLVTLILKSHNIHPCDSLPASAPKIALSKPAQTENDVYQFNQNRFHKAEEHFITLPYRLEDEMMKALKTGNENLFVDALAKVHSYTSGVNAASPQKTAEYSAVAFITEMVRAVISAGVLYTDAYEISDMMIYKISNANSIEECHAITRDACTYFLRLVKEHNVSRLQSPHIQNCKNYVLQHLNQPLSPTILSKNLNISKDYLIHIFSKDEHCPLMEYIYRERVTAASNMLKYSNFSIARIANYFQFKTQSHFSVVFKKYTGMTPSTFRKLYKQPEFE